MTLTRIELGDRISELKREDWPRFSLDHIVSGAPRLVEAVDAVRTDPALVAIVNRYLRHYVPGDCPCCGHGFFGWGIAWGAGTCSCGWPGRLFHVIHDDRDDPDLVCSATCNGYRVCEARRGDHIPVDVPWVGLPSGESGVRHELRCPDPNAPPGLNPQGFRAEWRPPEVLRFNAMLWVHPYEVHLRPETA